jgi:hypothetical protein
VLYGIDQSTRKLLRFDRSTGAATPLFTLPAGHNAVRGLAFDAVLRKLYYCDDATEALFELDPFTGVSQFVLAINDGPDALVDELQWFNGRLFGSFRTWDAAPSIWTMHLVEFDLAAGTVEACGPSVADCSAHSLVRWIQVSGPAPAVIAQTADPKSKVNLPSYGTYVFELRAEGMTVATDTVTITRAKPLGGTPGQPPQSPPR